MAEAGNSPKDERNERPKWSSDVEFLLASISFSVGFGNVWRFPYTAYENGGGAFVIPYLFVLIFIGQPIYYLEMARGQFVSKGAAKVWCMCPAFEGLGYSQSWATFCENSYYALLIALTLFYTVNTFRSVLPWAVCKPEWGSNCIAANATGGGVDSATLQSSSELYFLKDVIREIGRIDDGLGIPNWYLVIALFCAWAVAVAIMSRGTKSMGKAVYFTAIFPYVVMLILLVRACTLEGAGRGIYFLFRPKWKKLLDVAVWKAAVNQCFFSLGVGFGPIIMNASYNSFECNIYRNAWIVTLLDTFTSIISGVTAFGILGNLAYNLGINDISMVVKTGTALAFVSFPNVVTKFPCPQIFSFLFFGMLVVLGTGSLVALQASINVLFVDMNSKFRYWAVALITSTCCGIAGIVYTTPGGIHILELVDFYGVTYLIFLLTIFELIGSIWIFGIQNFCDDLYFMTGKKVGWYWRFCWVLVSPLMMIVIFVYSLTKFELVQYGDVTLPAKAQVAGWCIFIFGFLLVPGFFIYYIVTHRKETCKETILNSFRPNEDYGPADANLKAQWIVYRKQLEAERLEQNGGKPLNTWQRFKQTFSSK